MIIGVPKEIKNNEFRVALTPKGVKKLTAAGHQVIVEAGAGIGSQFTDTKYTQAGATVVPSAQEVFSKADMIVKVKEPLESEYPLIRKDQILFTYLHLAASESLTNALIDSGAVCIAYETIEVADGSLPLLTPMSQIAGRLSVQMGMYYLLKPGGGFGVLPGGIKGVDPCNVLIIGGGVVGAEAAKVATGMGAKVTILDINDARLLALSHQFPEATTDYSDEHRLAKYLPKAELVIGAVLIHGGKAPKLIKRSDLRLMREGTVIVDVAVDQGGCVESSRVTTHEAPTFVEEGIIHCGVSNLPGAVPVTSTKALTNVTLPYILDIANKGWEQAVQDDPALYKGLNIAKGQIIYEEIAEAFGYNHSAFL